MLLKILKQIGAIFVIIFATTRMKNVNNVLRFIISTVKEKINRKKWLLFSRANQPIETVIEIVDYKRSAIHVPLLQNILSK